MEEAIPLEDTKSGMFKINDNLVLVNSSENFRISAKVFSISPYNETYIQLELLEPREFIYEDEFWNSDLGLYIKDKSGTVAIEAIFKKLIYAFHLTYNSDGNFLRISDSRFNIDKIIFERKRKGRQSTEAATTRATRATTAARAAEARAATATAERAAEAREEEYEKDENERKRTRGSASGLKKKSSKKYIKNKKSSRKNKKQKTRKSKKNRKNKK